MRGINLLTGKYKEQAARYLLSRRTAVVASVVFLAWVLIVSSFSIVIGLMQAMVYKNELALNEPAALEAERLHRQAAEARRQNENAKRYFTGENLDIAFLGVIADSADDLPLSGIEMNSRERVIRVEGFADSDSITSFTERLSLENVFVEINVAELERRGDLYYFLLELVIGDA